MKALIVDDNKSCRETIQIIIDSIGIETVLAEGTIEALSMLGKDNSISIVFIDYYMKPFCGKSLVAAIRQVEAFDDLPLIMITGEDSGHVVKHLLKLGIDGYLLKPVSEESIEELFLKYDDRIERQEK